MFICKYCKNERKNNNSLKQHQIRCKLNPDRELNLINWNKDMREKHSEIMRNVFKKPRVWTDKQREEQSIRSKKLNEELWTEEKRKLHSNIMKKVVIENPEKYNKTHGNAKIYYIKNIFEEVLVCRGSWEKIFVEWCNENNILCKVLNKSFKYFFEESEHNYFPDFYLPEHNLWIEVKGYKTKKDEAKWKYFPEKLKVLFEKDIIDIKNLKII